MPDPETRITSETGGEKGSKLAQLAWAPPESLLELARTYGYGAEKYSPDNYRKGYKWSLSVNAMFRHVFAWLSGESHDPESGRHHLAHAAWHCLTLMFFEKKYPHYDDCRWGPVVPGREAESDELPWDAVTHGTPVSSNA